MNKEQDDSKIVNGCVEKVFLCFFLLGQCNFFDLLPLFRCSKNPAGGGEKKL